MLVVAARAPQGLSGTEPTVGASSSPLDRHEVMTMDTRHWDARHWDDLYNTRDQLFSGRPNGVLVTEAADLPPGRALDVGCGEGADALWLAGRGWHVTAVDISRVALDRAAAAAAGAEQAGRVSWTHADVTRVPPPAAAFDLVSAQYFTLPRDAGDAAVRGLLDAVAPGGVLLFVFHDWADLADGHEGHEGHEGHADLADYYLPHDVAERLDDAWRIVVDETRPRTVPSPPGANHVRDTVLRAVRLR